jgi:hypothetical protein
MRIAQQFVYATCRVSHELGHFEDTEFGVPVKEDSKMNGPQQFGIALTYARRYALMAALGLGPEDDPDAAGVHGDAKATPMPKATTRPAVELPEGAELSIESPVISVREKKGTGKSGDWTKWDVVSDQGDVYSTFSEGLARTALSAKGSGQVFVFAYGLSPDGRYKNLVALMPVPAEEPAQRTETTPIRPKTIDADASASDAGRAAGHQVTRCYVSRALAGNKARDGRPLYSIGGSGIDIPEGDGWTFVTLDQGIADFANTAAAQEDIVAVTWELTEAKRRRVIGITLAAELKS